MAKKQRQRPVLTAAFTDDQLTFIPVGETLDTLVRLKCSLTITVPLIGLRLKGEAYGPDWREYTIVIIGTPGSEQDHPYRVPIFRLQQVGEVSLLVWFIRITQAGSPLTMEHRVLGRCIPETVIADVAGEVPLKYYREIRPAIELIGGVINEGGRPPGKADYPTEKGYRAAIRMFQMKATAQGWDLTNEGRYRDDWIARQLGTGKTTMYARNRSWGISLRDIREGTV